MFIKVSFGLLRKFQCDIISNHLTTSHLFNSIDNVFLVDFLALKEVKNDGTTLKTMTVKSGGVYSSKIRLMIYFHLTNSRKLAAVRCLLIFSGNLSCSQPPNLSEAAAIESASCLYRKPLTSFPYSHINTRYKQGEITIFTQFPLNLQTTTWRSTRNLSFHEASTRENEWKCALIINSCWHAKWWWKTRSEAFMKTKKKHGKKSFWGRQWQQKLNEIRDDGKDGWGQGKVSSLYFFSCISLIFFVITSFGGLLFTLGNKLWENWYFMRRF